MDKRSALALVAVFVALLCPGVGRADIIGSQTVSTYPTGTIFSVTGLRYVAYAGTDGNHTVTITSSVAPAAAGQYTCVWSNFAPDPCFPVPGSDTNFATPAWAIQQPFSDDTVHGGGGVAIAEFNGRLYYAYDGTDGQINLRSSADGVTWSDKQVVSNTDTGDGPALASFGGRLVVAYTGTDHQLNVFSSPDGDFHGDATQDDKQVLQVPFPNLAGEGETDSGFQPSLTSFNGKLYAGKLIITDLEHTNFEPVFANFGPEAALLTSFPVASGFEPPLAIYENVLQRITAPVCVDGTVDLTDSDGDGLPDCWETEGIDVNGEGVVDYMPQGANPNHRDAYLEVDYFDCTIPGGDCAPGDVHTHDPLDLSVNEIIAAFANAPNQHNPDGLPGVHLVIDRDEALVHQNDCEFIASTTPPIPSCYAAVKQGHFGTVAERTDPNAANVLAAKALFYHYQLVAHNFAASGPEAVGIGGLAHICSPDSEVGQGDLTGLSELARRDIEATTMMHEFGHDLNLLHGGNETTN